MDLRGDGCVNGEERIKRDMIALIPQMKRFALSLTRSGTEADDLVQLTYERAIRSLDGFEAGTRLDSWMYRIMQNLHRNAIRDRATRERTIVSGVENADAVVDGVRSVDARLDMADVQRFMAALDDDHRTVLVLIAIEGHGYRDVADMLDVPIGTITSRLARARLTLREFLESHTSTVRPAADMRRAGGAG
jgi:RNA polymerase sigma-70 factor (ECF subfamily)